MAISVSISCIRYLPSLLDLFATPKNVTAFPPKIPPRKEIVVTELFIILAILFAIARGFGFDNLMKSIQFMVSTNLGEIVLLLVTVLLNFDMPLLPIQLLFINLVGDSLPSLALSVDHAAEDIMERPPVTPHQGIFTRAFTTKVVLQSLIIGGASLSAYMIGLEHSIETARTMTFAVMIFSQFTMIFSIRTGRQWFTHRFFTNRWLWLTIVLVTTLTLLVMLVPAMQALFKITALSAPQWGMVIGLSIGVLLVSELLKLLTRKVK